MPSARTPVPEVQLAAAVIHRALEDALGPDRHGAERAAGIRSASNGGVSPRVREEAIRFLLDPARPWREARIAWCDAAGIDPDSLVRRALQRMPRDLIPIDIGRARGKRGPDGAMLARAGREAA